MTELEDELSYSYFFYFSVGEKIERRLREREEKTTTSLLNLLFDCFMKIKISFYMERLRNLRIYNLLCLCCFRVHMAS